MSNIDLSRLGANLTVDGQKVGISNVTTPTVDSDAANKVYVDNTASNVKIIPDNLTDSDEFSFTPVADDSDTQGVTIPVGVRCRWENGGLQTDFRGIHLTHRVTKGDYHDYVFGREENGNEDEARVRINVQTLEPGLPHTTNDAFVISDEGISHIQSTDVSNVNTIDLDDNTTFTTARQIYDLAEERIGDDAVQTDSIEDGAVTHSKLSSPSWFGSQRDSDSTVTSGIPSLVSPGGNTTNDDEECIVVGIGNLSAGNNGIMIGQSNQTFGDFITIVGHENIVESEATEADQANVAVGRNNTIGSDTKPVINSAAYGINNTINSDNGVGYGENNTISSTADASITIGKDNLVVANNGVAIGYRNGITSGAINAITMGSLNIVENPGGVAMGCGGRVYADRGIAISSEYALDSEDVETHSELSFKVVDSGDHLRINEVNIITWAKLIYTVDGTTDTEIFNDEDDFEQLVGSVNIDISDLGITADSEIDSVVINGATYATSSGRAALAVGPGARALGNDSTAVGEYSKAEEDGAIALGRNSYANGVNSVCVGRGSSSGRDSIAHGDEATATGWYSVGLGSRARATHTESIAIGYQTAAEADDSIAIGTYASTGGINAIAVGDAAEADGQFAISLGNSSEANFNYSVAIGNDVHTTKLRQILIGNSQHIVELGRETISSDTDVAVMTKGYTESTFISLADLQTEVAAATDFADFQTRIAALGG